MSQELCDTKHQAECDIGMVTMMIKKILKCDVVYISADCYGRGCKEVYEDICETVETEVCQVVYEEKCSTQYEASACTQETKCELIYEQKCDIPYEQNCEAFLEDVCNTVTEDHCSLVQATKCETQYLLRSVTQREDFDNTTILDMRRFVSQKHLRCVTQSTRRTAR